MIGIDISSHSIKLVELEGSPSSKYRIKNTGVSYINYDPERSSEELFDQQREALESLKKSFQIKSGAKVIVSLPSNSIFVRYLEILKNSKTKDEEFVQFEAKQQIPFPIEEVAWDYFYLNSKVGQNKEAVLMAIKNELMEEKIRLIESVGLKTQFVNLDLINLINASFLNLALKRNEMGVLVDVGFESTGVIAYKKGGLWLRSIGVGSQDITKAISSELGVSFQEAEAIKIKSPEEMEKEDPETAERVRKIIVENLGKIAEEVEKTLHFFRSEQLRKDMEDEELFTEDNIARIILSGGIGGMEGVEDFFTQGLGMTTVSLDLTQKIDWAGSQDGKVVLNGPESLDVNKNVLSALFGVAIGAAIADTDKAEFRINFLRQRMASFRQEKIKSVFAKSGFVFIVLSGVIYLAATLLTYQVNRDRLEEANLVLDKFSAIKDDIVKIEGESDQVRRDGAFYINALSKRYHWVNLMNEVSKVLPLNIWFDEWSGELGLADVDTDSLTIKGYMLSYDDFNKFIKDVKAIDSVADVTPETIEGESDRFYFTISATLTPVFERVA